MKARATPLETARRDALLATLRMFASTTSNRVDGRPVVRLNSQVLGYLRDHGLPKADVDRALDALHRSRRVRLVPFDGTVGVVLTGGRA